MKVFPKLRGKLIHKLLGLLIKKRIENKLILRISYKIYELLNWRRYINTHKNENSHFIPKFLLKNFKIGTSGCIYEYQKGKEPKIVSVRKTATLPDFYAFKDKSGAQSDFIEKELFANLLEKYTPSILRKIQNHKLPISPVEESILSSFVASLYTRNPIFRKELEYLISFLLLEKTIDPNKLKDKTFVKDIFLKNTFNMDRGKFVKFIEKTDKRIKTDGIMLTISLMATEVIQKLIFDKELTFFQVSSPEFLFITDNPVLAFSFSKKHIIGPLIWEIKEESIIVLPFSPTTSLIYANRSFNTDSDKLFLHKLFWGLYPLNKDKRIFANMDSQKLRKII